MGTGKKSGMGLSGSRTKKKKKLSADEFFNLVKSKKKFQGPTASENSLGDSVNRFRDMNAKLKLAFKGGGRAFGKNS